MLQLYSVSRISDFHCHLTHYIVLLKSSSEPWDVHTILLIMCTVFVFIRNFLSPSPPPPPPSCLAFSLSLSLPDSLPNSSTLHFLSLHLSVIHTRFSHLIYPSSLLLFLALSSPFFYENFLSPISFLLILSVVISCNFSLPSSLPLITSIPLSLWPVR